MRQPAASLLIVLLLAGSAGSARAGDDAAVAWQAGQHKAALEQALSDRYSAIWSTLDARQKSQFGRRERAWLNDGRRQEERACIDAAAAASETVAARCAIEALERHLRSLAAAGDATAAN